MSGLRWRPMTEADLPRVIAIAAEVHTDFPEDDGVFAERRRLYPEGCLVLIDGDATLGYLISHPARYREPPKLNTLLGAIANDADSYYLHDIALLPEARGRGAGAAALAKLKKRARAEGIDNISLIAVNNSRAMWEHQGFEPVDDPILAIALKSYEENAAYLRRDVPRAGGGEVSES